MNSTESANRGRRASWAFDEAPVPAEAESPWRFRSVPRIILGHRLAVLALFSGFGLISARMALTQSPRVAVALFFALLGGAAVFLEPFLGVIGYYTLAFLRPQELFWGLGGARLTLLVSVSTLAATLIHFLYRPNAEFLKSPKTLLIGLLWLSIFLSTHYGRFADPETKWMSYYHKLFLIYFVVLVVMNSERKIYALLWVIALSVGYLAWWANEQHYFHGMRIVHGPGRSGSTLYDHNDFAMLIVMTIPALWFLMRHRDRGWIKLGLMALLPLAVHAIMVTFSRGGFLGLVAVMGMIVWRERSKKIAALLVLGGGVFFAIFAGDNYRERIGSIDDYQQERSASGRLEAWEVGGRMMKDNPVFGVGLRQFMTAFPHYSNWEARVAHNSWVQLGAECGFLAVGCYGLLVVLTALSLRRIRRRGPLIHGENGRLTKTLGLILESTLVGYLVCGFFLSMEDFEYFYLLVAMVQVLDRISARRLKEQDSAIGHSRGAFGGEVLGT